MMKRLQFWIIAISLLVILFLFYLTFANAEQQAENTVVDNTVWDYLRFLWFIITAMAGYFFREATKIGKEMNVAIKEMNVAIQLNNLKVQNIIEDVHSIRKDVKEINDKVEKHETAIEVLSYKKN